MNRTFTLKRLFLNLTALSVVLGIVAAFPQVAVRCFLEVALLFPALAICSFLAYFSGQRRRVFVASLVGAFLGYFLAPRVMASWDTIPSWWDLFLLNFEAPAFFAAIGALLFGATALVVWRKRSFSRKDAAV